MLNEQIGLSDQAWWQERLQNYVCEAAPPLFRKRSRVYSRKSRMVLQPLQATLVRQLTTAVKDSDDRLTHSLAASVMGVLSRYSGQAQPQRVVVGVPARATSRAEPHVMPLVVNVDPEMSLPDLVERVRTISEESAAHGNWSVERLLDSIGHSSTSDRNPLFSVLVQVRGYHRTPVEDLRNDIAITFRHDTMTLEIEYNANVHEPETISRFAEHLVGFMTNGLTTAVPICRVEYLSAAERRQLSEWSAGEAVPVGGRTVHALFEEQAQRTPEWDAVVDGDRVLTYAQADAFSNQLANYLANLGVKRGTRVAICLSPSAELPLAVLAVLKAGACAVPLVPTFPPKRNAMVLEDAAIDIVITESSLVQRLPASGITVVSLDEVMETVTRCSERKPGTEVGVSDELYVLFTSGSTGRPKGVTMDHRTLANLVVWQGARGANQAQQRTLQRTSIGFDVSFQEIFSTWAFGGSLVIAPDEVRDDVSLLPEFINRFCIGRAFLPSVALAQLVASAGQGQAVPTLREVIVAGEQLHITLPMRRFFQEADCAVDNQYGPTESHVVTAHALSGASTRWPALPPIGRPIQNASVHVLDPWLQPVPAGVPGELYAGGHTPARGYLRGRQTAERFVPDLLSARSGARMYRTGDVGRFLADGVIEFLGRSDDQVKIRGYRIELSEIEAHLLQIKGVRHAAVTVYETEAVGKQLIACVVTDEPGRPDAATLRTVLADQLPLNMVPAPSNFVFVDALPLTPTGKVDRRALPRPQVSDADSTGAAAQGDIEQTVAAVWCRALGRQHVGREDGFIELGGHSLVAIQVVSQLNDVHSISLPLRHLLRSGTTVATIAVEIQRLKAGVNERVGTSASAILAEPVAEQSTVPLEDVTLPNGLRVVAPSSLEANYLYLDVFEHKTYDQGGLCYPRTGLIFDVGAHIGLFSLYARQKTATARICAFEPCPPLFKALQHNTASMSEIDLFPVALSNRSGPGQLTYYPRVPGMTSLFPDDAQERRLLSGILRNMSELSESKGSDRLANSEEYLDERFRAETFSCSMQPLSQILAAMGNPVVDLLKIDVQKAEVDVLDGIAAEHWTSIKQLAIEVHDLHGRAAQITQMLSARGYRTTMYQDALHRGTVVHFVYAVAL